jgi:nucleotide-binding universal stress UspA family protein
MYRASDRPRYQGGDSGVVVVLGKKEKQAQKYLKKIASGLEAKGLKAWVEVLFWPPAESIVSYAEHNGIDLIVMSSHGRSGASRWEWGSVADRVLRSACMPVMVVRAPGCMPGI